MLYPPPPSFIKPPGSPEPSSANLNQEVSTAASIHILEQRLAALTQSTPIHSTAESLVFNAATEALQHIEDSSRTLIAILDAAIEMKALGHNNSLRSNELGAELVSSYAFMIYAKKEAVIKPNQAESNLLDKYQETHPTWQYPQWFARMFPFVELSPTTQELASPAILLKYSESAMQQHSQALLTLQELRSKALQISKFESGPESVKTATELNAQIDDMEKQFQLLLPNFKDIDPTRIPELQQSVTYSLALKTELANYYHDFSHSISKLIKALTLKDTDSVNVTFYKLCKDENGVVLNTLAAQIKTDQNQISEECILRLLKVFGSFYQSLIKLEQLLDKETLSDGKILKAVLGTELTLIFPDKNERSLKCLRLLSESQEAGSQNVITQIFVDKLERDFRLLTGKATFPFESEPNSIVIKHLIAGLLSKDELANRKISATLLKGHLQNSCEFANKVREMIASSNYLELNKLLDSRISSCRSESSSSINSYFLIELLRILCDDPEVKSEMRTKLTNLREITPIVSSLTTAALSTNQALAQNLEIARASLYFELDFNLNDYFGRKKIIAALLHDLQEHLLFLNHPKARQGIPDHHLFQNGYLLWGGPGGGKSFFPLCLANTLRVPLHKVSGAELEKYVGKNTDSNSHRQNAVDKSTTYPASDQAEAVRRFFDQQIKSAREVKNKSGVSATIFFLDEIEVLFPKRNQTGLSFDERLNANKMLEMIEGIQRDNPDIIFMAATNYPDLMDDAAKRIGRWGLFINFNQLTEQDADAVLLGSANTLGFKDNLAAMPEAEEEKAPTSNLNRHEVARMAKGMIPLALTLATNQEAVISRIEGREPIWPNVAKRISRLKDLNSVPDDKLSHTTTGN